MKSNSRRGFTLIELLIVITIIGILASIVMVSLNSARAKGADTAVKSNLDTVRSQAALFYSNIGRYRYGLGTLYEGNCLTNNVMFQMSADYGGLNLKPIADTIAAAIAAAKAAGNGGVQCRTDGGGTVYMVMVQLKSSNDYWCIDSTNASKNIGSSLPASGVLACP